MLRERKIIAASDKSENHNFFPALGAPAMDADMAWLGMGSGYIGAAAFALGGTGRGIGMGMGTGGGGIGNGRGEGYDRVRGGGGGDGEAGGGGGAAGPATVRVSKELFDANTRMHELHRCPLPDFLSCKEKKERYAERLLLATKVTCYFFCV